MPDRPILIVDDNADDVEAFKRLAAKCRLVNPLLTMDSAEKAICYLQGEGVYADRNVHPLPALVLLDLVMPGIGGLAVLEWFQHQPKREFPVVVLTGLSQLRQMQLAYRMGAHSFLIKPFEEREFLELLCTFNEIHFEK